MAKHGQMYLIAAIILSALVLGVVLPRLSQAESKDNTADEFLREAHYAVLSGYSSGLSIEDSVARLADDYLGYAQTKQQVSMVYALKVPTVPGQRYILVRNLYGANITAGSTVLAHRQQHYSNGTSTIIQIGDVDYAIMFSPNDVPELRTIFVTTTSLGDRRVVVK